MFGGGSTESRQDQGIQLVRKHSLLYFRRMVGWEKPAMQIVRPKTDFFSHFGLVHNAMAQSLL